MSSETQSIFNGEATPPVAAQPVVSIPPSTPTLSPEVAEYVGTGKKYASVDEAIKSVPHAQKHILTLQEELASAKAELEKRRTAEELLEELKSASTRSVEQPPQNTFSQDDIQKLVQQTIGQNELQAKATNNVESVKANFIAKFGEKAEAEYIRIAQESGLSTNDLNRLSASSPAAVFKLAGIETKQSSVVSKPSSSINTEALNSNPNQSNTTARVKQGASTKDLLNAWKIAGQKVGKQS